MAALIPHQIGPDEGYRPTHRELVVRAERWLRGTRDCSVVLAELVTNIGEIPDAIGWKGGSSTLIECKTSRADFFRDALKSSRKSGSHTGSQCYFLTRPGLIKLEELPPYWGLLEASPRIVRMIKKSRSRALRTPAELEAALVRQQGEIALLVSALRRIK